MLFSMIPRPPRSKRSDTLSPHSPLLRAPGARVAPVTPLAGKLIDRPEARHHWRTSRSHFVPSFFFMSWSYQTRSEEHTSELQSLMRISYAVFCLKKKIL